MSAELSACRTAAAALAADFHTAMTAFQNGGPAVDYAAWAQRLEQHLRYVLRALDAQDRGQPAPSLVVDLDEEVTEDQAAEIRAQVDVAVKLQQLARVRAYLDGFDSGRDNLQYAIEHIDAIVRPTS